MKIRSCALRAFAFTAAAALGGCLISETPLLDARNGRATPIAPGLYQACEYDKDGGEPDCKPMEVSYNDKALYTFTLKEEGADADDVTLARFRRIASGAWLSQLHGGEDDDEDYFYFIAETVGDDFVMAMVVCEDIPEATRKKYVARAEMEVDDEGSICTAKTLRAVTAATKAYRAANPVETRSRIVYSRVEEKKD